MTIKAIARLQQTSATSKYKATAASLKPAAKEWTNKFVAQLKSAGMKFEPQVQITQGTIICLRLKGPNDKSWLPIVVKILKKLDMEFKVEINKTLSSDGHKYWSLDTYSTKVGIPNYITMDELYGSLYIQF